MRSGRAVASFSGWGLLRWLKVLAVEYGIEAACAGRDNMHANTRRFWMRGSDACG